MSHRIRQFFLATFAVLVSFSLVWWQWPTEPQVAEAGDLTAPTWTLSSSTLNATNVTYTHSFTTATALGASSTIAVNIMSLPPSGGQTQPVQPDFTGVTTLGSGSSPVALRGKTVNILPFPGGFNAQIPLNTTTLAASTAVTLQFTGVRNPPVGGVFGTKTQTYGNTGAIVDGSSGPDNNGAIQIGDVVVSGTVKDADTNIGLSGVRLAIRGTTPGSGFWTATTNSSGTYTFVGVPNGTYFIGRDQGFDPQSSTATTLSQYLPFAEESVTFSGTALTKNFTMRKSNKIINATVQFEDDGTKILGASVNAFSMGGGGGFNFTTTNSSGLAQLRVGGNGTYMVMAMPPFGGSGTSFAPATPTQVSFTGSLTEAETRNVTIKVKRNNATVTGKLVAPNGTALPQGGGMGAFNRKSHSFLPVQRQANGSFSFGAPANSGTWELNSFDPNQAYTMPKISFTIQPGANDIGTIKMVELTGRVTVTTVRTDTDAGLPNIPVMAMDRNNPGPPNIGFTNNSGVAILKVAPDFTGTVMANPGGSGGPGEKKGGGPVATLPWWQELLGVGSALAQQAGFQSDLAQLYAITPPQKVSAGASVTIKFKKANFAVNVRVVDADGNPVNEQGFVSARPAGTSIFGGGFGGQLKGGLATVNTVEGANTFKVFYGPDSGYVGQPKTITITSSGSNADILALKKNVTVKGKILDGGSNNSVIADPNLGLMIGFFTKDGDFSMGKYNPTDGDFVGNMPPDTEFRIGVASMDAIMGEGVRADGYVPSVSNKTYSAKANGTVVADQILFKVDSQISGKVTDQNGTGQSGLTIIADPGLAELVGPAGEVGPVGLGGGPGGPEKDIGSFSAVTDQDGNYTMPIAPGKYNLVVNARDKGLFVTGVTQVELKSKDKKTANMQLSKPDAKIKVNVDNQSGDNLKDAVVTIYNDSGTISFTSQADGNGEATINVPAGSYNVRAGKDSPEAGNSQETVVAGRITVGKGETGSTTLGTKSYNNILATPVTTEISTSGTTVVTASKTDGTAQLTLTVPGSALSSSSSGEGSSSSGTPLMTVTPKRAEAPATKDATPILAADISAVDGSGNPVTTLSSTVTGSFHYDQAALPAGVNESKLEVRSYNSSTGTWTKETSSVDAASNNITFSANHFSDFAVTATVDNTPPAEPTEIKAEDLKIGGHVRLTWKNPTDSDFSSLTVYRSAQDGVKGPSIRTGLTETTFDDPDVTDGTKYYYTVKAVDTSANESTNTAQVSATPTTVIASATPAATITTTKKLPKTGTPDSAFPLLPILALSGLGTAGIVLRRRISR